jgi:hypothetical protein
MMSDDFVQMIVGWTSYRVERPLSDELARNTYTVSF